MKRIITIADIRRAAAKAGGRVVSDGAGGYDLLAPDGRRWAYSETWCQPIPLAETQNKEDKQEMLQWALDCCISGFMGD